MTVDPPADHETPDLPGPVDTVAPAGAAPPYDAVIFDMDGVVTDTGARRRMGRPVHRCHARHAHRTRRTQAVRSGRAREEGVAALLAAHSIVRVGDEQRQLRVGDALVFEL